MTEASTTPPVEADRGFYLYGVVPADTRVPDDLSGMDEGGVVLVEHGPVAVLGEWVDISRPLGRKRHLVAHSEVLNTMAQQGPVLPLQFGSVVDSEEAAADELLTEGEERFVELLAQARSRLQYLVRFRYDLDAALAQLVEDDPTVAELRRRTQDLPEDDSYGERMRLGERVSGLMDQRRAADADALAERLETLVEAIVPHEVAGMDGLAEFAVCVPAEETEDFEQAMELLAEEVHAWARTSLVGPMALYDFVSGE